MSRKLLDLLAMPLPSHAYVPGVNERHKEGFLDHVIEIAPPTTTDENANENTPWHFGLRLIDEGFYWEAHEVLEAVWLRTKPNSRERYLVQGTIQIANALLKHKMNKKRAVERLCEQAGHSLDRAYMAAPHGMLMGIPRDRLEARLAEITVI